MSELVLPDSLQGVEPVRSIRTPARLDYRFTAGAAASRFLRGVAQRKILGERCPICQKVYVPPRGSCPVDGIPTAEQVEVAQTGTITTYCVVNLQFYGQGMEIPYVSATVLLDGADIGLFGLIQGAGVDDVRMGMRVRAVWVPDDELKPSLESIKWYEPTGEPDADYESYREHL